MKERTVYKKFNELMKNVKIVIHNASASLTYKMCEQKVVICLFEKHITENDEQ